MEPIATALAALMAERGFSQTQLWAAADLSPAVVSSYLSGKRGTTIDRRGARTIERMAVVLKVAPEYFVEYRAWQVREIARQRPAVVDDVYGLLIAAARLHGLRLGVEQGPDDAK